MAIRSATEDRSITIRRDGF